MNAAAAPRSAARKKRTRWAIIAVVVVAVLVVGVVGATLMRPKNSGLPTVATATVVKKSLTVLVSGTGETVVADSVDVNPEITGTVEKLYVSLGETVTAGDDLYKISSSDVDAQLLKARASLLQSKQSKTQALQAEEQANGQVYSAKTQQVQAQQNLDRLESQPATAPSNANEVTIARRQLKSAKHGVEAAEVGKAAAEQGVQAASANLKSAQRSYDDALADTRHTVVTAPITGVVTALPISVGSQVAAGSTSSASSSGSTAGSAAGSSASGVSGTTGSTSSGTSSASSGSGSAITISDMSSLKVQIAVSEVDIPTVVAGQSAVVTFDSIRGESFTGKVGAISPNGTTSSGVVNYTVDINLDALDANLKPDMTATGDITTLVADGALVVPNAAVKNEGATKYVNVVGSGGQIKKQTVTVGVGDESYTEVKAGLTAGMTVSTSASTAIESSKKSGSPLMPPRPGGTGGPSGPGGS
jgi:multidrug efflux pump subunit AcrA (membrane-fusion protein)